MNYYRAIYIPILLVAFFDPQNGLGMRQILTYLSIPLWIYGLKPVLTNIQKNYSALVLGYIAPIWGLVIYMVRGDGSFQITDTSYISFAFIFSIIYLLESERSQKEFQKASIICGLIFSGVLIYVAIELVILNTSSLIDFAVDRDIARISYREYGGINIPYVYFYASTLLILPLSVLLNDIKYNKNKPISHANYVIMLAALFLSGTRSHITISILFFLIYIYVLGGVSRLLALIIISGIAIYYGNNIADALINMFSLAEATNAQKSAMLGLYASIFNDPVTFLVGQGFQAVEWSHELRQMVNLEEGATKTELTFIELFRVFGLLIPSLILVWFALKIFGKTQKENEYKLIALTFLLFDSALNPHLFSTYGAIILAIVMSSTPRLITKKYISKQKQSPVDFINIRQHGIHATQGDVA